MLMQRAKMSSLSNLGGPSAKERGFMLEVAGALTGGRLASQSPKKGQKDEYNFGART